MSAAEARSIDDTLSKVISQQLSGTAEPPPVVENPVPEPAPQQEVAPVPEPEKPAEPAPEAPPAEAATAEETPAQPADQTIDEYGNPIAKPRMYTEDEVQEMMRQRFNRTRQAQEQQSRQQPPPQQHEQPVQPEANGEEWESQLNQFIDRRVDQREQERQEKAWREEENARQSEFEDKFTSGMNRYSDFRQVTANMPITDAMMIAARDVENPAALIYGICKMYPQEVKRIASLHPMSQAAEMGRLHERMLKHGKTVSAAPKPMPSVKGDMPVKQHETASIEDRINQHAKQKRARY